MPSMNGPEMAASLRKQKRIRNAPILSMSAFEGTPAMVAEFAHTSPLDFLFNRDPDILRAKCRRLDRAPDGSGFTKGKGGCLGPAGPQVGGGNQGYEAQGKGQSRFFLMGGLLLLGRRGVRC